MPGDASCIDWSNLHLLCFVTKKNLRHAYRERWRPCFGEKWLKNEEVTIELVNKICSANYYGDITAHLHQNRQKLESRENSFWPKCVYPHPPWGTGGGLLRPRLFKCLIMSWIGLLSLSKYYYCEFAEAHHSIRWATRAHCLQIYLFVGKEFARYFLDTTSPLNSTFCYQYAVIVKFYAGCSMWSW